MSLAANASEIVCPRDISLESQHVLGKAAARSRVMTFESESCSGDS